MNIGFNGSLLEIIILVIIIINTTDKQKDGPTPHHEFNVEFRDVSVFRALNHHPSGSFSSHTHSLYSVTTFHASPPLSYSPSVSFLISLPPSPLPPRLSSSPCSCSLPCGRSSPPLLALPRARELQRVQCAAAVLHLLRSCSAGGGCAPAAPAAAADVLLQPAFAASSQPCAALLAGRVFRAP